MKLIIDIDDEDYKRIQDVPDVFNSLTSRTYSAIRKGTPLPKGHGRLIDADRLKIDNPLYLSLDIPYVTEDTVEEIIDHAPTIIEANRGSDSK